MSFWNHYPYTDFHELNLDWIINILREMEKKLENFVTTNSIKYANPFQWSIVNQYEKNTLVIEPNTGTAYLSVQAVPQGVNISNTDYWTPVFDLTTLFVDIYHNFTGNDEYLNVYASNNYSIGDWLLWRNKLYHAIAPINAGEALSVGSNIEQITVESAVKALSDAITDLESRVDNIEIFATPEMFGAVGDGIANDTDAVKEALNTGKPVIFQNTYKITEPLEALNDVYGPGCLFMDATAGYIIHTAHDVKGLEIKSNNNHLVALGVYVSDTTNNPIIEDCYIHDLYNSESGTIDHSVIGILVTGTQTDNIVTIQRNVIKNIIASYTFWQSVYNACGIFVSCLSEAHVDANKVINVVDSYNGDGISIIPRSATTAHYSITNNNIKGCGVDGIKINARYSLVDNNIVDLDSAPGVAPFTGIYGIRNLNCDTVISNNTVFSNNSNNSSQGIYSERAVADAFKNVQFLSNKVINTLLGIYINTFAQCTIKDNYFESSVANHKSIIALGAAQKITGNINAHYLECGADSVITDNELYDIPSDALKYMTGLVITNNKISNSVLQVSSGAKIIGNELIDSLVQTAGDSNIVDNIFNLSASHTAHAIAPGGANGNVSGNIIKANAASAGILVSGDYKTITGNNISGCTLQINCPSTHNVVIGNIVVGSSSIAAGNVVDNNIGI